MKTGSELLKEWRKSKDLTQAACAKLVGATQAAWNDWESGRVEPRIGSAIKIEALTDGAVPVQRWLKPGEDSGPLPTDAEATGPHPALTGTEE